MSFSKVIKSLYVIFPLSIASSTASETIRLTMLETRVVARLTKIGRICVVAKITADSAAVKTEKAKMPSRLRRVIRRR